MPSFKTPTQEQIDAALQRMRSPEFDAYFFSRLHNPHWVLPLNEKGLFDSPPPAIRQEGTVSFPNWPASKYLARMTQYVPSDVARIFSALSTDNASVNGDMLKATLAMPPDVAATLVPTICRAAETGTLWFHFTDASDVCARLAEGGEVHAAMMLADALFTPRIEEGRSHRDRHEEYSYKKGLKKVAPILIVQKPHEFVVKLCDWLQLAVDATKPVDPDSGLDESYWWRPAIEEHEQNREHDFAGVMAGFVRQWFEDAIGGKRLSLNEALEIAERYPYLVFKRIRVHLIHEFAEQAPELARRVMMDRDLFDNYQYKHEYAMLVGARLGLLTPDERATWFSWVDAGPDMRDLDESVKDSQGRDGTEEDRQNRKRYWQFGKLHCVRKHLEGERQRLYQAMLAEDGEPELADLNFRVRSGWVGNESPMAVDDLASLTFEQAVERVSSWRPGEHQGWALDEPDIGGLAATFEQYLATGLVRFSSQARLLIGRPAIYVRAFVRQMTEAVKAGVDIDITAVMGLCHWVVQQPLDERTTPRGKHERLVDDDWQWTRDAIARLIEQICKSRVDGAPKYPLDGLRERMWGITHVLCRGRAKSYILYDESEEDPRSRDYAELAINSPRGKAMEAALAYADWVANHVKKSDGERDVLPGGFDAMPEVRGMLEWQISSDNRSFEALAVIGFRIGLIHWIDRQWLAANASTLFHLDGIAESPPMAQGWAAWNGFLAWVRPHIEFYELFKEQFAYAVAEAGQVSVGEESREQPMHRLGEHLMVLYGRGQLGLDDDDGLLRRFLAEANPDIRRHAITFVGDSLQGRKNVPDEVLSRFQVLWNVYWAGEGKRDAEEKPDAWLFGAWFACGLFPEQWALEQLEDFVTVTATAEPDHLNAKELARVAQTDLARTLRILDCLFRGNREGWRIHEWLEEGKPILEAALKAGGAVRVMAEQIIDYLGRRGYTELGDLLDLREGSER